MLCLDFGHIAYNLSAITGYDQNAITSTTAIYFCRYFPCVLHGCLTGYLQTRYTYAITNNVRENVHTNTFETGNYENYCPKMLHECLFVTSLFHLSNIYSFVRMNSNKFSIRIWWLKVVSCNFSRKKKLI